MTEPLAHPARRHLQHPPLPRARRPHQPRPDRRRHPQHRRRRHRAAGGDRRRARAPPGHAEELGALLGMGWVMAPARHLRGCLFGNVVLSRLPIRHHAQYDLSWKTCEPRCCQRVDIAIGDDTLHLYNVHLGTAFLERRHQAGRLSAIVHDRRVGTAEDRARRLQRVDARAGDADAERAAARASTCARTCGGGARIRASSRCCTWITSTTRGRWRS